MRLLAIDYGAKRSGLAVSDPDQIIAVGLATVETHMLLVYLHDYIQREKVEKIIIGEPLNLDDTDTDITERVREFIKKLKRHFPEISIIPVDERFTSKMAQRSMLEMGMKKKQRQQKGLVDEIAATLILQEYMSSEK
ncbi:MAG: Holliday junction resolvase RuvX [Chitinophagaceae bacterium]